MDEFMKFIQESQQQAKVSQRVVQAQTLGQDEEVQQNNTENKKQKTKNTQMTEQQKKQLKEQIIQRVNGQTIEQITEQLLNDNKIALNEDEKRLRKQYQKLVLIQKGGVISKREYKNYKDLKKEAKERRQKMQIKQQQLLNDQMQFYDKKGKKHALLQENTLTDDQITSKNINRKVAEAARQFSDNRGQQFYNENNNGGIRVKDGEVNLTKQLKQLNKQKHKSRK